MNLDVFTLDHEYIFDLDGSEGYSIGSALQQGLVIIDHDENQSRTLTTFEDGLIVYSEQDKLNKKVRLKSNRELDPSEGFQASP